MSKKMLIQVVGAVFILIGLLGFLNDPILGLLEVDPVHNIIHLVSGAVAFYLARTEDGAITYGKVFAVVYGLVTVLGFLMVGADGRLLGLMDINMADNVLHLVLTALFAYVGFVPAKKPAATTTTT